MQKLYYLLSKLIVKFIRKFKIKKYLLSRLNFSVGLNSLISNRKFYEKAKNINEFELKINSQNGEDGIIDFLIYKLNIPKPTFVEIGVGEYIEANTRFLYDNYYQKGLIIDCIDNFKEKVSANTNLWRGDLTIIEKNISSENINTVLKDNCSFEIDLFSIDIDGIDYWVIEKLKPNISKIFIVEYNSVFGDNLDVSVPNIEKFDRHSYHYSGLCYGMSLKAISRLMKEKGFYLIGTNNFKNNAFFINHKFSLKDYFPSLEKIDYTNLKLHTQSLFAESRNKLGKLNYLRGDSRLKEIKDCEIVDFSDKGKLKKIGDLIDI